MKALLIDPAFRTITKVDYTGDFRQIYELIDADNFDVVSVAGPDDKEVSVFVDGEGLLNNNPHGWFTIEGYAQPLRGRGLVLGTDEYGESVDAPIDTLDAARMVQFLSEHDALQTLRHGGF